jgi:hypothetical protein
LRILSVLWSSLSLCSEVTSRKCESMLLMWRIWRDAYDLFRVPLVF